MMPMIFVEFSTENIPSLLKEEEKNWNSSKNLIDSLKEDSMKLLMVSDLLFYKQTIQ